MQPKLEYLRIDDYTLMSRSIPPEDWVWLNSLADVEYRQDYCCHFVLKNSHSHTIIALRLGDIFT